MEKNPGKVSNMMSQGKRWMQSIHIIYIFMAFKYKPLL